jgi:hypothetical protein
MQNSSGGSAGSPTEKSSKRDKSNTRAHRGPENPMLEKIKDMTP